jgi:transposase
MLKKYTCSMSLENLVFWVIYLLPRRLAEKMVAGKAEFKRNRFLKVSGSKKEINYKLAESSKLKAGIKGYVTDLDILAQEVIDAYHQLFQVETSFRMAKSDLRARPIFHHKRDSIEAHLTIVFAALAMTRLIQDATGMSIKKFLRTLKVIQTGIVLINGKKREVKPILSDEVVEVLRLLEARCGSSYIEHNQFTGRLACLDFSNTR